MRDNTNKTNIIQFFAFYGLTIVSDECIISPACMLLTATEPD
jgi:hypothetical protein